VAIPYYLQQAREESVEQIIHKPTLTVEEICEILPFSPYVIRQAARRGELRAIMFDHHIYGIRRQDLIDWLRTDPAEKYA